jgi:hypothetical protein
MMVTEPTQPQRNPITESVKNIIGAINLTVILTTVVCMVSAAIYLIFFENPLKSIGFVALATGVKYLFTIRKF